LFHNYCRKWGKRQEKKRKEKKRFNILQSVTVPLSPKEASTNNADSESQQGGKEREETLAYPISSVLPPNRPGRVGRGRRKRGGKGKKKKRPVHYFGGVCCYFGEINPPSSNILTLISKLPTPGSCEREGGEKKWEKERKGVEKSLLGGIGTQVRFGLAFS